MAAKSLPRYTPEVPYTYSTRESIATGGRKIKLLALEGIYDNAKDINVSSDVKI